jgi:hypothetical protein
MIETSKAGPSFRNPVGAHEDTRLLETLQNLVTIFTKRPAQDFLDPLVSSAK